MRIGLVRHFAVEKKFLKGRVRQSQVLQWFKEYDQAPVASSKVVSDVKWQKCYSSELPRAVATAQAIFNGSIEYTGLLNEPTLSPIFQRDVSLPFLLWAMVFRGAILFNHTSQQQGKKVIEQRIHQLLTEVLQKEETEVLIVSHAFVLEVLSQRLLTLGFKGRKLSRPQNGVLYLYER